MSPDLSGLLAGRVGRPHGLDGSFHVTRPNAQLLDAAATVLVDDRELEITRRAGTDAAPDPAPAGSRRSRGGRGAARQGHAGAARGGARARSRGVVGRGSRGLRRARRRPRGRDRVGGCSSCPRARCSRSSGQAAATCSCRWSPTPCARSTSTGARSTSTSSSSARRSRGRPVQIDVFTLFPEAFAWFERQRHVANALAAGHRLEYVNYRDHTPLSAGPGRRHPVRRRRRDGAAGRRRRGGAAGAVRPRSGGAPRASAG